jgi:hypothetical protein
MTYLNFESLFLLAIVDAADASDRGQCEAFGLTETVLSEVSERWVRDAVLSYEQRNYLGPVSRPLSKHIGLQISGEARKTAEILRAAIAADQQPRARLGF